MRFHLKVICTVSRLTGDNMPLRRELEVDKDMHFISSRVIALELEAL